MSQERRTITVSEVIRLLDEGMHRPQIAEYFGLSMSDVNKLFKNAALKGKKARKAPEFVLVDDTVADTQYESVLAQHNQELYENMVNEQEQESNLAQEDSVEETRATNNWNN